MLLQPRNRFPSSVTPTAIPREQPHPFIVILYILTLGVSPVKTFLALSAVIVLLGLLFFRFHSESGMKELERCQIAVRQAKSWTVETTAQYGSNGATTTTRNKVSCPDDYEYFSRSRGQDEVVREQYTIHTHGVTYVETVDGKWEQGATTGNSQVPLECGKGPALVQMTVSTAILELPRRRAGKIVKGELQTVQGISCQEWSVDFGNEWPQVSAFTVCIVPETHLPRRISFEYPNTAHEFTGWNITTVLPPPPSPL